jgi:hypothetical protein
LDRDEGKIKIKMEKKLECVIRDFDGEVSIWISGYWSGKRDTRRRILRNIEDSLWLVGYLVVSCG